MVSDIGRIIDYYRSDEAFKELTRSVNACMNDILVTLSRELPSLADSDIRFMTYLYAGFSPRAVCLMVDSKLKNFYNRRTRLKEKIMASDAPHREWFAAEM